MKTYGLSNELFEVHVVPGDGISKTLYISDIRMLSKSSGKGCTLNLGRYAAASVTHLQSSKGEKLLGFLHGGMFITGSGMSGCLTDDISVVKLLVTPKTTTCIITTVRAETASLPHYMPGEPLQHGCTPPPLIGHQLTVIKRSTTGKSVALLRCIYYLLFTIYYLPFSIYYLLYTIYYLLFQQRRECPTFRRREGK